MAALAVNPHPEMTLIAEAVDFRTDRGPKPNPPAPVGWRSGLLTIASSVGAAA